MTTIYYDPDESHRFTSLDAEPSPGLEALTGADFLISTLPIDPVANIVWHVANRSIPVNLKVGYDSINHSEQRHKFAARIQKLGFKVAFLLGVGSYRNKDGLLQVSGYKAADKIPYTTFQQMKLNEATRGIRWDSIDTLDDLPDWIKAMSKAMELPTKNVIFTKTQYPLYEWYDDVGDPWQTMEEVSQESIQHILACGLPGFGPKRANAVITYLEQNKYPICLYTALAVICQIDEKGKRVHKIPGIGAEYWKRSRDWLFRDSSVDGREDDNKILGNINLCIHSTDNLHEFWRGARSGLSQFQGFFQAELEAGKNGKTAFNNAMDATTKLVDEFYKVRQLPGDEIPF